MMPLVDYTLANATTQIINTTTINDTIANATTEVINATTTLPVAVKTSPIVDAINTILRIKLQNPWVMAALPLALILLLMYTRKGGINKRNILFFLSRAILITLLITALASPILRQSKTEVKETPTVRILLDETPSMGIYGNKTGALASRLRAEIISAVNNATEASEKITVEVFSTGEKTMLGEELYKTISTAEGDSVIILLSDGNSNQGKNPVDVARQLGKSNTTIYTIAPATGERDILVRNIKGESKVTTPLDYQAEIEIEAPADEKDPVKYKLTAYADGREITSYQVTQNTPRKSTPLTFSLNGIGVHKITAEVTAEENNYFTVNDKMLKTVEVVEKPEILLVTNKTNSPLKTILGELYNLDLSDRIPNNFRDYDILYLDDVNANAISKNTIENLKEYILNGNGLAVVGGKNSFDYGNYNNSYFETLLPVLSMEKPPERRKQIAVVILIDISGSTEYGMSDEYKKITKIDFEKALAIKILRNLDLNDSVAVVAFNTLPYVIAPLDKLGERRVDIEDTIAKLQFGGGTEMLNALETAENMLKYHAVNKYVIVLSDGVIRTKTMPTAREKARLMSSENIKVYTVGVGFDTDEVFMQSLAEAGNGIYFKPEAYQRINIEFGRGLEEETPGMYAVDVRDEHHFITRNINLSAQVGGYNKVYEKTASQLLLTTKGGNPILAVWNFGLGRVAALTTDDGTAWAGRMYEKKNNKLISAMTNWVIGDLEKNKKTRIKTSDTRLGETTAIKIESKTRPGLSITKDNVKTEGELKSTGLEVYSAQFKPNETGFYLLAAMSNEGGDNSGISVNYPTEYAKTGPDLQVLSSIAREANGRMYETTEMEQLKADLLEKIKKLSTKTIEEEKPLYPYLIGLMLALYFIDTAIRRIQEIRRLR
ncbi:MAG: VWA domain-containing protein [Candidatus Altiarchaeales archaeon]|nr:VWA domain-containing protein [Candidatus Altiarchaeales archaeon]